ncbi:segregation/condensation protein A [Periweissella beninensis]|uniref:Segregation and condensation protein A n=2 Tax=Periweissella beninensis TaxID=504936 RepID=A0ABT0VK86_9LACO|nr:segregation/condensation protein A [Periweissella beninensis]
MHGDVIMNSELQIKLSDFEGPLDLLLHLIKKAEVDIYDIPIVQITEQYMEFLHSQPNLSLDIAGEFLVMAASLMQIKSRYLLPQQPTFDIETGDEVYQDPRQDLVNQLLEYKQYQQAANQLHEYEQARQQQFSRTPMAVPHEIKLKPIQPGIELADLQAAFTKMLKRKQLSVPIAATIKKESYTITQKTFFITQQLAANPQGIEFKTLFNDDFEVTEYVTTFLAMLEMTKHHKLLIKQTAHNATIMLYQAVKIN